MVTCVDEIDMIYKFFIVDLEKQQLLNWHVCNQCKKQPQLPCQLKMTKQEIST